jgi:hypothetical protein
MQTEANYVPASWASLQTPFIAGLALCVNPASRQTFELPLPI